MTIRGFQSRTLRSKPLKGVQNWELFFQISHTGRALDTTKTIFENNLCARRARTQWRTRTIKKNNRPVSWCWSVVRDSESEQQPTLTSIKITIFQLAVVFHIFFYFAAARGVAKLGRRKTVPSSICLCDWAYRSETCRGQSGHSSLSRNLLVLTSTTHTVVDNTSLKLEIYSWVFHTRERKPWLLENKKNDILQI